MLSERETSEQNHGQNHRPWKNGEKLMSSLCEFSSGF